MPNSNPLKTADSRNAELAKVSAKCQRLDRYRRETERLSYYV